MYAYINTCICMYIYVSTYVPNGVLPVSAMVFRITCPQITHTVNEHRVELGQIVGKDMEQQVSGCVSVHIKNSQIYTHTYIYIYTYMCVCVCVCVCHLYRMSIDHILSIWALCETVGNHIERNLSGCISMYR